MTQNKTELGWMHTDLAVELRECSREEGKEIPGVAVEEVELKEAELKLTKVEILDASGAERLGKPVGTYLTLEGDFGNYEEASIEELAKVTSIPADVLNETMTRYAAQQKAGTDEDFGRTATQMTAPLETAPYYAVRVTPAIHHTMGGLSVNTETQVLKADGTPIPGLYAAGEVTGGLHGANRLGGNGVADIVVNGRLAGQAAVQRLQD